jgi:hypothetical protein
MGTVLAMGMVSVLLGDAAHVAAAGNVTVSVVNGTVMIVGDPANNVVGVSEGGANDELGIFGGDGTTINGDESVLVTGMTGRVTIDLGAGDDDLEVGETPKFPSDLRIMLGDGNDELGLTDTYTMGILSISCGDGDDDVSGSVVDAGKTIKVIGGDGDDEILLGDLVSSGRGTRISGGEGNDVVFLTGEVPSATSITTGRGNDSVLIDGVLFLNALTVRMGGEDDHLEYGSCTFDGVTRLDGGRDNDTLVDAEGNTINGPFMWKSFEVMP